MINLDDHHDEIRIMDFVQDSIVFWSNSVSVVPREFLTPRRPRVTRQGRDFRDDPTAVVLREGFDVFAGRRLDEQPIACHDA